MGDFCAASSTSVATGSVTASSGRAPLLALHRFPPQSGACFWRLAEERRSHGQLPLPLVAPGKQAPALAAEGATTPPPLDFCSCLPASAAGSQTATRLYRLWKK